MGFFLLSSVTGLWTIGVYTVLASRHPGRTMIQYVEDIFGEWIGKLIGLYMMYYLFLYVCTVSDELKEFYYLVCNTKDTSINDALDAHWCLRCWSVVRPRGAS